MSASILVSEYDVNEYGVPASLPIDPRSLDLDGGCQDRSSLSRQLAIVREMLSTLDTLTVAGQQHNMGKVVAVIQDQIARTVAAVGRRNHGVLLDLLDDLTRECGRLWPNTSLFSHRAESLVAMLATM